jgi:hypothetical protein
MSKTRPKVLSKENLILEPKPKKVSFKFLIKLKLREALVIFGKPLITEILNIEF